MATDCRSQDGRRCLTVGNTEADIESTTSEMPCGGAHHTLVRGKGGNSGRVTVDVAVLKREDKSLQTTIMLITVSTSYVLAYLPVLFYFLVYFILLKIDSAAISADESMLIAGNYTKLLYVGGVAVNFFLYTVSGRVFRNQLIRMLSCRRNTHLASAGGRRQAGATDL